jgi:protein phosphatase 1 regulatory subunit 11
MLRESSSTSGSRTITGTGTREEPVVLTLHAVQNVDERRVTWDEGVIDNENLNKKSSKSEPWKYESLILVCCIYHKPREVGESSSEEEGSSSSSSEESDSDDDRPSRKADANGHGDNGHAERNGQCKHHGKDKCKGKLKRKPSPNAYERQPRRHAKKNQPEGNGE